MKHNWMDMRLDKNAIWSELITTTNKIAEHDTWVLAYRKIGRDIDRICSRTVFIHVTDSIKDNNPS